MKCNYVSVAVQVCHSFDGGSHLCGHPEAGSCHEAMERMDHTSFRSPLAVWWYIHPAVKAYLAMLGDGH